VTATHVLLLVYAAVLVGAGLWVARRVKVSGDFFVASRNLPGSMVFVTMLAANIGAGSTVGATGLAYRHGLSAWWWSGSAAIGCLVLGLLVAPRMHRLASAHGFFTVGDFLEWRFDRSVRVVIAAVLWVGTLALLAGQLIAMAWAFEVIAGLPRAVGALLSAVILVLYVSGGGLLASAWVNLLQLVTLLVGFLLAIPFAFPWMFGKMAGDLKQGIAVLSAMFALWFAISLIGDLARSRLTPKAMQAINRITGLIVLGFGTFSLASARFL